MFGCVPCGGKDTTCCQKPKNAEIYQHYAEVDRNTPGFGLLEATEWAQPFPGQHQGQDD
jgi:hypothetical protein